MTEIDRILLLIEYYILLSINFRISVYLDVVGC